MLSKEEIQGAVLADHFIRFVSLIGIRNNHCRQISLDILEYYLHRADKEEETLINTGINFIKERMNNGRTKSAEGS